MEKVFFFLSLTGKQKNKNKKGKCARQTPCTLTYAPVRCTHLATRADPFSIRDFGEGRVKAVDVVRGGAGVTAQQLSSVLAHPAEFNVVVILLFHPFISPIFLILPFTIGEILPGLPLDALLLLVAEAQSEAAAEYMWVGERVRGGGYVTWSEKKMGGVWGGHHRACVRACVRGRRSHSIYVHICVESHGGGGGGRVRKWQGRDKMRKWGMGGGQWLVEGKERR